jgi:hypothetical protein
MRIHNITTPTPTEIIMTTHKQTTATAPTATPNTTITLPTKECPIMKTDTKIPTDTAIPKTTTPPTKERPTTTMIIPKTNKKTTVQTMTMIQTTIMAMMTPTNNFASPSTTDHITYGRGPRRQHASAQWTTHTMGSPTSHIQSCSKTRISLTPSVTFMGSS